MLTKNILPYLVSVIILRMALSIPGTINLESTLSYLGLGLGIDTPSLGLILSKVRGFFLDYPYLLVFLHPSCPSFPFPSISWATLCRMRLIRATTFDRLERET